MCFDKQTLKCLIYRKQHKEGGSKAPKGLNSNISKQNKGKLNYRQQEINTKLLIITNAIH